MSHHGRIFVLLVSVLLLLNACLPIQAPSVRSTAADEARPVAEAPVDLTELDAATVVQIDGIVQQAMTNYPAPGFQLCVVKDGRLVYRKGFGLADVDADRPVTPQSLLTQMSVTKTLTAAAILKLAEEGAIDIEKPVIEYLPDFTMADERYRDITVGMLLSHRSGLPDSPTVWQEPLDPAVDALTQAVRALADMELLFAPDTDWSYSSWGYSLLGAIISAVTGEPYAEFMETAWLEPLGMSASTFDIEAAAPISRTTLYKGYRIDRLRPVDPPDDPRDVPAGGLWSNCDEMARWALLMLNRGQFNGQEFLQPASIDAMWEPLSNTGWMLGPRYGPAFAEYGLGWFVGERAGHRLAGHMGDAEGANIQLQLAPDDALAVIAMENWHQPAATSGYPASFAAIEVLYLLLGIQPD
jgi:CubicO group peptidase (beta-lactamase class C family)